MDIQMLFWLPINALIAKTFNQIKNREQWVTPSAPSG